MMSGSVPKKTIVIFGKRIPVSSIPYLIVFILVVVSIFLPWISYTVTFPEPSIQLLAAEGKIEVKGYLTGEVEMSYDYTIYGAKGEVSVNKGVIHGYAPGLLMFLALVVATAAIYLYLFLLETEKFTIGPRFLRENRALLDTLAVTLIMVTAVLFVHVHNILVVSLIESGMIADLRSSILVEGMGLSERFYHTTTSWNLTWGLGYTIFFIASILAYVNYIDKYLLKGSLNLSSYWRVRGHLIFLSFLMFAYPLAETGLVRSFKAITEVGEVELIKGVHAFTGLFHISYQYTEVATSEWQNRVLVEMAPGVFIALFVLIVLSLVIFMAGVTIWPSRYVMKAEPFITLALPDEEILKRHKALPIALMWRRALDWVLSLIALLMLVIIFLALVKFLGHVAIVAEHREHSGTLWTTLPATILVVCVMTQLVLALKPTK